MTDIEQHIEALIFASEEGIRQQEIQFILQATLQTDLDDKQLQVHLSNIKEKYQNASFAIELAEINQGYQFLTKKTYYLTIQHLQSQRSKKKLSQAALETLAVITYKQPVTKLGIEQIRGVNCDYTLQKLLEKELIVISGKADTVGKPLLYSTSPQFADYMGIHNLSDLPKLPNDAISNTIGEEPDDF